MTNHHWSDYATRVVVNRLAGMLDGGYLDIFTGPQPLSAQTPLTSQVRLASLKFQSPAFSQSQDGAAQAYTLQPDLDIAATGRAVWYRRFCSDHMTVIDDGSVGVVDCDVNLNSVDLQIHGVLVLDDIELRAS